MSRVEQSQNSRIVEEQICEVEKKVVNELGILPDYANPHFMKVWNHLLADEMMLAELTSNTLESASVKALLALQESSDAENQRLRQERDQLMQQIELAENAIAACPPLKEWGRSTPAFHGSRVVFLCNLYSEVVNSLRLQVERAESAESRATSAEARVGELREALKKLIDDTRKHAFAMTSGEYRLACAREAERAMLAEKGE